MEQDLDTVAKALLVEKKVDKMLEIVEHAKELRKLLRDEHKEVLAIAHDVPGLDEMSVSLGLTKVSENFFNEFETTLYEIAEIAREKTAEAVEIRNVELVEQFIVSISQLKPRSIRHLDTFFTASLDGEWVDGLFVAKGKDSEFRCIDRCSDATRAEFGLDTKK